MAKKRIMWMLGATLSGGAGAQKPSPKTDSATETITLRVLNGDTGLPMPSPKLELGCRTAAGQRCSVQRRVETAADRQLGVVKFKVSGDASAIFAASPKLEDCNLWTAQQPEDLPLTTARGGLSAVRISRTGIALANACNTSVAISVVQSVAAHPGEVVVFYRNHPRLRRNSGR